LPKRRRNGIFPSSFFKGVSFVNACKKRDKIRWQKQKICSIMKVPDHVKEAGMSSLKRAVTNQRWDLAAYTIVLASARVVREGGIRGKKKSAPQKRGRKKGR
jgi:hypothetical protein